MAIRKKWLVGAIKKSSTLFFMMIISTNLLAKDNITKTELLALDAKINEAYGDKNADFLEHILTKDFVWFHSGGRPMDSKEATLKSIPDRSLSKWLREEVDIRIYGHTAVISSLVAIDYKPGFGRFHLQRVFIKDGENWKMLAQHTAIGLDKGEKADVLTYVWKKYWSIN